MQPLPLLLWGFALGLQAAAPIGPVNLAIISRGLRLGGAAAFFLGCGAVTADCAYFGLAILATRAAGSALAHPWVRPVVFLAGGAQCYGWSLPYGIGFMGDGAIDEHGAILDAKLAERARMMGHDMVRYGPLLRARFDADVAASPREPGFAEKFKL